MTRRLVITGMGAITPIGNDVSSYWAALLAGKCGISHITRFDVSKLPVKIAAEVRGFDAGAILSPGIAKSSARFLLYALAAAEQAMADANLSAANPERTGICMGTAMAGMDQASLAGAKFNESASGRISPHLVPGAIANMACSHLAIRHGLRGPGLTLSTACAAGSDAIIAAAMLVRSGEADAVVVMGGESILSPAIVSSLAQARALSRQNDRPQEASRPFDLERDGFVIGEGGGAIVLESEAHAIKRGAKIHAELAGWANGLDCHHITAPDPTGSGAAACMEQALEKAGLQARDIDYVNAHGTSTRLGDLAETIALKKVFGGHAPPVSSTKGATGHLMGAGGLTELVACVKSIQDGMVPPTLNHTAPDPECDLDYIPEGARKLDVQYAMSNAIGFGGQNSSLIVARYAPKEKE